MDMYKPYAWPLDLFEKHRPFLVQPKKEAGKVDIAVFESMKNLIRNRGYRQADQWQPVNYVENNQLKRDFEFYPSFNPNLKRLSDQDEKLLEKYKETKYVFPVLIDKSSKEGFGLFATRHINKGELICLYAGNIINGAWKEMKEEN